MNGRWSCYYNKERQNAQKFIAFFNNVINTDLFYKCLNDSRHHIDLLEMACNVQLLRTYRIKTFTL